MNHWKLYDRMNQNEGVNERAIDVVLKHMQSNVWYFMQQ